MRQTTVSQIVYILFPCYILSDFLFINSCLFLLFCLLVVHLSVCLPVCLSTSTSVRLCFLFDGFLVNMLMFSHCHHHHHHLYFNHPIPCQAKVRRLSHEWSPSTHQGGPVVVWLRDWSRDRRVASSIPETTDFWLIATDIGQATNTLVSLFIKQCKLVYQIASGLGWDTVCINAMPSHSAEPLLAKRLYAILKYGMLRKKKSLNTANHRCSERSKRSL